MKIVIEIDEEDYKHLIREDNFDGLYLTYYEKLIVHGTPLPKGHGRIIDESKITTIYYHEEKTEPGVINFKGVVIDGTDAPTIIKADEKK